jgi:MoaA/NifB/PqqE/SkfB family radical SAM enzyme
MWHLYRVIRKIVQPKDFFFYLTKIRDLFFYQSRNISAPIRLQLEPVSYCNLRCEFCVLSQMKRERKVMSVENITKIVQESGAKWIQLSGVGETFLHPDIVNIMFAIKAQGKILKITTNGTPLSEEICRGIVDAGVDYVDISIDTTAEELYQNIRGANLKKVLNNVRYLYEYRNAQKSKLVIGAKHVYNDENIDNLSRDIEKLTELPFDEAFFLWVVDAYEGATSSSIKPEYLAIIAEAMAVARRLKRPDLLRTLKIFIENYHLFVKGNRQKVCFEPVYAPYVTVDGDLTACCKSSMWILQAENNLQALRMGNVIEQHFNEAWNSQDAVRVRRNVLENRAHFAMCQNCEFDQHQLFKWVHQLSASHIYKKK